MHPGGLGLWARTRSSLAKAFEHTADGVSHELGAAGPLAGGPYDVVDFVDEVARDGHLNPPCHLPYPCETGMR